MYDTPQECLSTEDAASIILNDAQENLLCEMQPTCVDKNSVFIVDLEKFWEIHSGVMCPSGRSVLDG